jgi:hypothetical protein
MSDRPDPAPAAPSPRTPVPPGDRVASVAERIRPLIDERERARAGLGRAEEDLRAADHELNRARTELSGAEQAHARLLAASYRDQGEGASAELSAVEQALQQTRDRASAAEGRRRQAERAIELLREDITAAEARLHEGATEAKREVTGAIMEDVRISWSAVSGYLEEMRAIRAIPEGDNPPTLATLEPAAEEFQRELLDEEGGRARRRPPGFWGVLARFVLTVVGAALVLLGTFLPWAGEASGMDLDYGIFLRIESLTTVTPSTLVAGGITVAIGTLALLGLTFRSGWLSRVAGALGLAAFVLFAITVFRGPEVRFPTSIGPGMWLILAGSLVVLGAGFAGRRRRVPVLDRP